MDIFGGFTRSFVRRFIRRCFIFPKLYSIELFRFYFVFFFFFSFDIFKNIKMEVTCFSEVSQIIAKDDLNLVKYLQEKQLLLNKFRCNNRNCRRMCVLMKNEGCNSLGYCFYCRKCKKKFSLLTSSFFQKAKLPIRDILVLMWIWSCGIRSRPAAEFSGFPRITIIQYYRYFRDIVSWKLLQNDDIFVLGGPACVK